MMERTRSLGLIAAALLMALGGTAQNLVPNPSFEDASICNPLPPEDYEFMLGLARPWFSPNLATPDIYDVDLERRCGVPMDPADTQGVVSQGFQLAQQGSRLAGAYQWFGPGVPSEQDTREYLMIRLEQPLVWQQAYMVTLWYSRAEGYRYAVDHIGVHFASDSIFEDHPTVLDVVPQLRLRDPFSLYLTEGDDWVELTDTLVASGGEQWMVIGTFEGSDQVNGFEVTPSLGPQIAYYYFDAISVEHLSGVGIEEWHIRYAEGLLELDWRLGSSMERVRILDMVGRVVAERSVDRSQGRYALDLPPNLPAGLYLVEVSSAGRRSVKKFVKGEGVF